MSHLRRFGLAISLTVVLAGAAIAGETNTPPCANPGETNTPPCTTSELITDETSEASYSVSSEVETMVFEAASYAVESLLTLF